MNPAALRAALDGDLANANIAATSGGIEAQERQGTRAVVESTRLPIPDEKEYHELREMGVKFGKKVDDLFVEAELPEGWNVKQSGDRNAVLLDEKDRERATMFIKLAFYDRYANIATKVRFVPEVRPVKGWDKKADSRWAGVVLDAGTPIICTVETAGPEPEIGDREKWQKWTEKKKQLFGAAIAWLEEHYPDWRNVNAYWNED